MLPAAPKLDTRTYDDLVDQVETLAEATTPWRRAQPGEPLDFGGALIRIFGRMMERTITRLNQVPEKNFLAFLDLLGTQILPPKPARVPLTFELAKGRNAPTVIPAGTRVAATLTAEETDQQIGDILFETEKSLVATPVRVTAVLVKDPATRRYIDISAVTNSEVNQSFAVFQTNLTEVEAEFPAVLIGFDRSPANQPISLFAATEPPSAETAGNPKTNVRLVWEYKNDADWRPLSLLDETQAFSQPGLLTFISPPDFAHTVEVNQAHCWIRARWVSGQFQAMPRLRRLLTNTVWATQAVATAEEILGSSNGEPDQVFQAAQTPVLLGQTLYVRERELPAPAEALALRQALGPAAIQPIEGVGGDRQGAWVQWQAVPDFYGSSGGDRHYILDYLTGQIYFGNDQAGRTPPQGRNNVRISYRTGGGSQGNRPAGNILQLKSAVPYVNGVTNLEPARGGADAESLEQIKQRGPKQIRHRFRAVTVQDYEDLAYEASSEVARAKAFAADSDPINRLWLAPGATALSTDAPAGAGQVVLVVVPDRAIPQPIPSLTLINQVEDYILSRCGGGIKVQVGGPQWRKVTIRVEVVPASLEAAIGLDIQVVEQLNQFLHPLTGGSQGQGWAFGRMPQTSDIYALLGGIAGVDHARVLDIDIPAVSDSAAPPLVFSGDHQVSLTLPEVNR